MRKIVCVPFFLGIFFLFAIPAMAQKDNQQSLITQEQINQINEIVKPLKERLESQLNEDRTGNYKAYQDEIKKMNGTLLPLLRPLRKINV